MAFSRKDGKDSSNGPGGGERVKEEEVELWVGEFVGCEGKLDGGADESGEEDVGV